MPDAQPATPADPAVAAQAAAVAAAVSAAQAVAPAAPQTPAAPAAGAVAAPAVKPPAPDAKPAQPAAFDIATWKPKLPDGAQALDQKKLTEVHGIVFNEKLSPAEKMQALADFQVRTVAEQSKAIDDIMSQQQAKDFDALKADPTYGGARLEKTIAEAREVVAAFGGEKASKILEVYGLNKNPELVTMFAKFRSVISEDTIKGTARAAPVPNANDPVEQLKTLYPNSWQKMLAYAKK